MRLLILTFCLLAATACSQNTPTSPTVPLDRAFTLAPSDTARIEGTTLAVQFVRVSQDSRCPAWCISAGDANLLVRVIESGATTDYDLHTDDNLRRSVVHRGVRITLAQLQPSRPILPGDGFGDISPGDYRATLQATR